MVITIDGPGGAGKTTIAKALAKALGYSFLDTGALYRAIALNAIWGNQDLSAMDDAVLKAWLSRVELELSPQGLLLDGREVETFIRNEEVAAAASKVSTLRPVREFLLNLQHQAAEKGRLVAEGRDMGTVVFPNAEVKFFLTAEEEERARRRLKDLLPKNPGISFESVRQEIAMRDQRDSSRSLAPLKPAPDAVIIDNTNLNQDGVLRLMLKHVAGANEETEP